MADKRIKIKIGRNIEIVGKSDSILDNGSCVQVTTQKKFGRAWKVMSKKLFKDLKTCAFIFVDETLTAKAAKVWGSDFVTYYKFDIDRMIASGGYEVIENE